MLDLLISIILGTWAASKLPPHIPDPVFRVEIQMEPEEEKVEEDNKPDSD